MLDKYLMALYEEDAQKTASGQLLASLLKLPDATLVKLAKDHGIIFAKVAKARPGLLKSITEAQAVAWGQKIAQDFAELGLPPGDEVAATAAAAAGDSLASAVGNAVLAAAAAAKNDGGESPIPIEGSGLPPPATGAMPVVAPPASTPAAALAAAKPAAPPAKTASLSKLAARLQGMKNKRKCSK